MGGSGFGAKAAMDMDDEIQAKKVKPPARLPLPKLPPKNLSRLIPEVVITPPAIPLKQAKLVPPVVPPQQPQFKYAAPVEASVKLATVINRALQEKVYITVEELLALAPEVRKYFKETTTTRKVPTGGSVDTHMVLAFSVAQAEEPFMEVEQSLPLRTLTCKLNDALDVTGILDGGCQVVIIRQDIWECLGVPMRQDYVMHMESANGQSNLT